MAYSKEEVIRMCKEIHGDKYGYSITDGVQNVLDEIEYICPIHGVRKQTLYNHLQGKGCNKCANNNKGTYLKFTNENFIEKSKKKHTDLNEYDFSELNVDYRDEKGKIELICKKHGKFKINPMYFVNGGGCPYCHGKTIRTDEEVREELSKLHPELDFSQTKYSERDSKYRIKVMCPKHGEQLISYYNLKNGQGCYWCGRENTGKKNTITNEEFIKRGRKLYGDKYTYEHLDMNNRDEKGRVTVTCPIHGDFKVTPDNFYHGHACSKCQESRIERQIRVFLEEHGIEYIYQCGKSNFNWLGLQRLDFYLPKYNAVIECQGEQHFIATAFGSKEVSKEENLEINQKRDRLKLKKCTKHNIPIFYYADYDYDFPYKVYRDKELLLEDIKKGVE